ncbi:uncharacterized protein LOC113210658 [Frankliniella occidentalis]|uniref:Uncharacterized protein LOC113210658 n=1 Tax=Frankliniella occidentalis TaxID=133901 RepID=A0A6J1SYW9_FRAOC|nr:uncharacterized protein LOC113210658 [Frankliniella occidentalis]
MGIFKINGVVGKQVPSAFKLIVEQLQDINLKAVKNVVVAYDPFDERSVASRKFLEFLNFKTVTRKFPDFAAQTQIKCDRSEPTISFDLITGKKVLFKAGNLTTLEMFRLYNQHITPHAPEEETQRETLTTKAMRKGGKK